MIKGRYFSAGAYQTFSWDVGDDFPEELDFDSLMKSDKWAFLAGPKAVAIIRNQFENIPKLDHWEIAYIGETAKFILLNLFLLKREGIF